MLRETRQLPAPERTGRGPARKAGPDRAHAVHHGLAARSVELRRRVHAGLNKGEGAQLAGEGGVLQPPWGNQGSELREQQRYWAQRPQLW